MKSIDLNCDLGEGCGNDAELMKYISSANIACGYHAGDTETMRRTVELAVEQNVAIGAHPGYADKEDFGRRAMSLAPGEVVKLVSEQILSLREICREYGTGLHHVKPHGALYNQAAKDIELAAAIAEAVAAVDDRLILYGLSGSVSITAAEATGLRTASEVFADRTYTGDGSLTPRTEVNALIKDREQAIAQVLTMVKSGTVETTSGATISIKADTVCIHGDGEHAVEFARTIRDALDAADVQIQSPAY